MSLFLISRTVSCGKGPFFLISRTLVCGGGFLVFSVSLDMEEDSWFFRLVWIWRRILGFFRLVVISRISGVANQGYQVVISRILGSDIKDIKDIR